MKTVFKISSLFFLNCLFIFNSFAQCPVGFDSVNIVIRTHITGYEAYWQLVNDTSPCGTNVIFAGGNTQQMDCNGANANVATPGHGYASFDTITEGPWCLNTDSLYSIQYIDDAGASDHFFDVLINGFPIYHFHTMTNQETFTFRITPPLAYNTGLEKIETLNYVNPGNVAIKGKLFNYSSNTIDSLDLNYSIDNGNTVTQHLTGLNFTPFTTFDFTHPVSWVASNGDYILKVWASNLNGFSDMDSSNDTLVKNITVGDPIPNIIDQYLTAIPVYTLIGDATNQLFYPCDLDFQTLLSKNELWVLNMGDTMSAGSTVTFYNAGKPNQVALWRQDEKAMHFMFRPSALTFSDNTNFATSAAVLDAHHMFGHFAGPTLWSSDSLIYAQHFPGLLGSHLDMLHQSPWSMGIAEEHENVFWVYDGYNHCIVRYDYVKDHGPGHDNHEDGIVRRYTDIVLDRINDTIPSHMVLDHSTGLLYVVDNGNARVVRMDINTGSITGTFPPYGEPLAESSIVTGTTWGNYITSGIIQPCGIDLIDNRLLVSDYSNGDIIIYDNSGSTALELGRIQTGIPGVAGIKIGPDGKIWYVNQLLNTVYRIDGVSSIADPLSTQNIYIYPNPAHDKMNVMLDKIISQNSGPKKIQLINAVGKVVFQETKYAINKFIVDVHTFASGIYILSITDDYGVKTRKVVIQR